MSALAEPVRIQGNDEYVRFCEGVRRLTQIDLLQYKRAQMERRIRSFAGRSGITELPVYLELLGTDADRLGAFLDHVTINVSQLYRNPDQWDLLAKDVLPELAAQGRIKAWSAGCSYGAEAYTLAALCLETAPGTRPEIHGTDIDARVVLRAKGGRFSEEDARSAPPKLLARWFEHDAEGWVAKPELRAVTRFETGDLLRMPFTPGRYDLVLCRNTVIYFNQDVRDALHARIAETLRPGGYLLVGSTERVTAPAAIGLESTRPFLYRRSA